MKVKSGSNSTVPFWLYSCFLLFRIVPKNVLCAVNYSMLSALFFVIRRFRTTSMRNLHLVFPRLLANEREQIYKSMKRKLARSLAEILRGDCLDKKWLAEKVDMTNILNTLKETPHQETGVIIVCGHISNFEASAQALAVSGFKLATIARPMKGRFFNFLVKTYREMHGNENVSRKGAYREAVRRLKAGKNVGILFDQNVTRQNALFIPFFGHLAATTKLPALLSYKTRAPLVFIHMIPEKSGYTLVAKNMSAILTDDDYQMAREDFVNKVSLILNVELEERIMHRPENWFWMHRRWKTQPTDALETVYATRN